MPAVRPAAIRACHGAVLPAGGAQWRQAGAARPASALPASSHSRHALRGILLKDSLFRWLFIGHKSTNQTKATHLGDESVHYSARSTSCLSTGHDQVPARPASPLGQVVQVMRPQMRFLQDPASRLALLLNLR